MRLFTRKQGTIGSGDDEPCVWAEELAELGEW